MRRDANPAFFQAGGTLSGDAPSYITRPADAQLLNALRHREYCLVLAPRQSGKSSLMVQVGQALMREGSRCGFVDLQPLGREVRQEHWYGGLVHQLLRGLSANDAAQQSWRESDIAFPMRLRALFEDHILAEDGADVVVFLDEIDSVLSLPFSDDFFLLIRSLYNARATSPTLARLSFVLLGVTQASSLVRDQTRTPFNIGREIVPGELPEGALAAFSAGIGEGAEAVLERVYWWTRGQPYLFQALCSAMAKRSPDQRGAASVDEYVSEHYLSQRIESHTHFNYIQSFLRNAPVPFTDLLRVVDRLLDGETLAYSERDELHSTLLMSGLVRIHSGEIRIYNRLYEALFGPAWVESSRPPATARPSTHVNALPDHVQITGYELLRVLGTGGFGITYLALEPATDRTVVIKEYFPSGIARRDGHRVVPGSNELDIFQWGLQRFRHEASMLASLSHPNIVRVAQYFEANDTGYLVMAYEPGSSLEGLLRAGKAMSEAELLTVFRPLMDALEHVHGLGLLHRDIKPGNILVRPDGTPLLTDFGAAREFRLETQRGVTVMVTESYSPIEQYDASASGVGPWSDIYALGAVMYECVTGKKVRSSQERQYRFTAGDADMPSALELAGSSYSRELLEGIDCALDIWPTARPQTIAQLRERLPPEWGGSGDAV